MRSDSSELVGELLDVADYHVSERTGLSSQLNARRAVSTAYYALFHALSSLCADMLAGDASDADVREMVYRALGHGEIKATLESREAAAWDPRLKKASEALNNLQERREAADYASSSFVISPAEALNLIGLAREAISQLDSMDWDTRRKLAVLLLAKSRPIQKRR